MASAMLLAAPAAAPAATRLVDDDRVQCPSAAFTSIQAAIDASARADTVKVCRGTYAEQLTLPEDKPQLTLTASPARAARIVPPPGGLAAVDLEDQEIRPRVDLILVRGTSQRLIGFSVGGLLSAASPDNACDVPAAVELWGPNALADGNLVTDVPYVEGCSSGLLEPVGIRLHGTQGGKAIRNRLEGVPVGIRFDGVGGTTAAQGNTVVGNGAQQGIDLYAGPGRVQSNEVTGNAVGINLYRAGFRNLVTGNEVHHNGAGIRIGDATVVDVVTNLVRDNAGTGIEVLPLLDGGQVAIGRSGMIKRNQVRRNGGDGILVSGCPVFCTEFDTRFDLTDNLSLDNAGFDCREEGKVIDHWLRNTGRTSSPPGLCIPPR